MLTKELGPKPTLSVFVICGIIIVIITGLLSTQDFGDIGDSIYSIEDIDSGGIKTHPIYLEDDIDRIDFRIDVLGVDRIDVYLTEAPSHDPEDMSGLRIIRSGVYTSDSNEPYSLHWSVSADRVKGDKLLRIVENTDGGDVPASNGTIHVVTRYQSTVYQEPTSLPQTYGLIIASIAYVGAVIAYYRKSRVRGSPSPQ